MSGTGTALAPLARLSDAQRLDWLRLIRSESVGPQTFRALLNRFGGAGAALAALPELAAQRGRRLRIATREDGERELAAVAALGARFVALGEPDYPPALRAIEAAPPLIAVLGDPAVLQRPTVALVGSRNASGAGLAFTERLVRDLGAAGFVVISGLARGVDARAHRSSLATGTVAVLAGGLDRIYPAEHKSLAEAIIERGALVSEMPVGWEPRGRDFPRRNRIVSGLALGTVVIEAARRSGSLITARFAAEQGREVFAVPGSPLDPRAEGTNGLLRQGATFCTCADDVLAVLTPMIDTGPPQTPLRENEPVTSAEPLWDELDLVYPGATPATEPAHELDEPMPPAVRLPSGELAAPADGDAARRRIEELLGPSPVSVDDLVRVSGVAAASVQIALFELELEGRLVRHGATLVSLSGPGSSQQSA